MPIGVIVPKKISVKGMVKICAEIDAASESASFSGTKRMSLVMKKLENKAIPKSAE